jgi:hypothetical protein
MVDPPKRFPCKLAALLSTRRQERITAQQQQKIEALAATIQKVSNQLELNNTAPRLVSTGY